MTEKEFPELVYQWFMDDQPVDGAVGKTFTIPEGSEDGSFTVKAYRKEDWEKEFSKPERRST